MITILLIILILALIGSVPTWPYSRGWGYYPSGGIGTVLLILLVLYLLGIISGKPRLDWPALLLLFLAASNSGVDSSSAPKAIGLTGWTILKRPA